MPSFLPSLSDTCALCDSGNIWVHLSLLLALTAIVLAGSVAPWPLAGSALLSLLLPVMLCLSGSVTYHTLMANHWNYHVYITIDVSNLAGATQYHWFFCKYTSANLLMHMSCVVGQHPTCPVAAQVILHDHTQ